MTTLLNYLAVQDCNATPSNEWEASYSQSLGNNVDFLIYGSGTPPVSVVDVNYLDVKDAFGIADGLWFVNRTSVDSGNNSQIYFNKSAITGIQIFGTSSSSANAARTRSSTGTFDVNGSITATGNADYYGNAAITGFGDVVASAGRRTLGSASFDINGNIVAIGKINGEEWTNNQIGSENWNNN
jgi:hypothetical protein